MKAFIALFSPFSSLLVGFLNSMKCVYYIFCAHLINDDVDDAEETTFLEVGLKGVDPVHQRFRK